MISDLHDASLEQLSLALGELLEVGFTTVAGEKVRIRVLGLIRLRADDFRQGNIVLAVETKRGSEIELSTVAQASGEEQDNEFVQRLCGQARTEDWSTLEVSSSFGCVLAAVGKTLEIIR